MSDEINIEDIEGLIENIKEEKCILFLGSAVHTPAPENSKYKYSEEDSLPLAGQLANLLAKECQYKKKFNEESCSDLQRISLFIETDPHLGRRTLVDKLNKYLYKDKKPSHILNMLTALPFKIIVTTNYDQLIELSLRKNNKDPFKLVYNPTPYQLAEDMSEEPSVKNPLLFKMHGDLSVRESIVITDEDYITFIQRMSEKDQTHPIPFTVRYWMKKYTTLFIGYSLKDYNLRLLFKTLRWKIDPVNFPLSFSIDSNPDPLILKVWQDKREIISFIIQDLWTVIPCLYKEIMGKEYREDE